MNLTQSRNGLDTPAERARTRIEGEIRNLEVRRARLIADCNFWEAHRSQKMLIALGKAGMSLRPEHHGVPTPPDPNLSALKVGSLCWFSGRRVKLLALAEQDGYALVKDREGTILTARTKHLKPEVSRG